MKKRINGFTLIELLVAMTIVAVLTGISLVSYQGARKAGRDGKRKADLEQIRSALEMCRTDSGSYPLGSLSSGSAITCNSITYLTIPNDVLTDRVFSYTGTANTYTLCTALEVSGGVVSGCGSCTVDCNYKVVNP
jgi:prepilin-type N-terminal cleavage/methylation domain-containing protein